MPHMMGVYAERSLARHDLSCHPVAMPKRSSKPKKPRKAPSDLNALASFIVDAATAEPTERPEAPRKNPAAVALGRLGGLKGGAARAKALSKTKRAAIAKKAAKARWAPKAD